MPRTIAMPPSQRFRRTIALEPGTGELGPGARVDRPRSPKPFVSRPPDPGGQKRSPGGFTLIELIIVVAIVGILATIAVPAMRQYPMRAKEAALKEDLFTLRSCIDQFHADRARYPSSLEEMVGMGYMRSLPRDPITGSTETWVVVYAELSDEQDEREQEAGQGIIDVHSGADGVALDGTRYSDW